jgi:hypothetical protein
MPAITQLMRDQMQDEIDEGYSLCIDMVWLPPPSLPSSVI